MTKVMNHTTYPELMKTKTVAELLFIRHDAHEASEICGNENFSYYADEALYAAAELASRSKKYVNPDGSKGVAPQLTATERAVYPELCA